ncbi:DegV family protein [Chloroflexota bacterium]
MNIKIVTDSTSDLPAALAQEKGITVMPVYVNFGSETYRDRVDIFEDEFYSKLENSSQQPSTEPPTPEDFADVYRSISNEADGIVSIHVSTKLSATCNSAQRGRELANTDCPIEIIDSETVTMGLGLLVLAAQDYVNSGKSFNEVTEEIKRMISSIQLLGLLDTLKYLAEGGRIGKASALLGSVLSIKPLLTISDGEIVPAGQVRTREKGIDELYNFARNTAGINDIAIVYSVMHDEVQTLIERLGSIVPKENIRLARLGPALAVHAGPSILFMAIRG